MQVIMDMIKDYSNFIILGLGVVVLLLFILVIVLYKAVTRVENKYRRMMRGTNSKNLEALILSKLDEIDKSAEKADGALSQIEKINENMKNCVNKVAIMRYKAFEDVGSDLSFSVAILDDHNDGVILTGIYTRLDSTTYAKPIDKGISRYDLSEEELHVLKEAINK